MLICMNENRSDFKDSPHGSPILNDQSKKFSECPARERDFLQNCQDAPHGNAFLNKKTLRFRGCSAQECDFIHIFRMLRTGMRCYSIFSGCSARERNFLQHFNSPRHPASGRSDPFKNPLYSPLQSRPPPPRHGGWPSPA